MYFPEENYSYSKKVNFSKFVFLLSKVIIILTDCCTFEDLTYLNIAIYNNVPNLYNKYNNIDS